MRRTKLLQLLQDRTDLDYVERFQGLAAVNLEVRRAGANAERLLRKAGLEMDVGNHAAALGAARHAAQLSPREAEPHFLAAKALVLLALVRARILVGAPGVPAEGGEAPAELLHEASREFRAAIRLNPADEEACQDASLLDDLIAENPGDRQLERALRRHAGGPD